VVIEEVVHFVVFCLLMILVFILYGLITVDIVHIVLYENALVDIK